MFNPKLIKKDFPMFISHPNLIYLDSGASSFKPISVINKEDEYYKKYSANIFRGIYKISEKATQEYELVRDKTLKFLGGNKKEEIVFVRNTTEAINLVSHSWGRKNIKKGDEIVTTIMEHHANFVPWQILCKEIGATFKIAEITNGGLLDEKDLLEKVTFKTKLVVLTHVSNVLGTINPIKKLTKKIKQKNPNCLVLVDGAQAAPYMSVNVSDLGCDFYALSSHKMLGPTGVGVLWGKYDLLESMDPYQYGGEMIEAVYRDHTTVKKPPYRFEAGTPHIAGVIGFGAALDYLENIGRNNIRQHEQTLVAYGIGELSKIEGLTIIGPHNPKLRSGVLTFAIKGVHAHDIAQVLDSNNICIRSGHHCAMPLHIQLQVSSTARASINIFNTKEDIDLLVKCIHKVKKIFT